MRSRITTVRSSGALDAETLGRLLAADDRGGVQHRLEHLRVGRRRGRIDQATQAGDEIGGAQRIAVRPAQVLAQVERVFEAIRTDGPGFRRGRHGTAVGTDGGQPLEQVAQDVERGIGAGALRVERVGFGPVAAPQRRALGGRISRLDRLVRLPRSPPPQAARSETAATQPRARRDSGSVIALIGSAPLRRARRAVHRRLVALQVNQQQRDRRRRDAGHPRGLAERRRASLDEPLANLVRQPAHGA